MNQMNQFVPDLQFDAVVSGMEPDVIPEMEPDVIQASNVTAAVEEEKLAFNFFLERSSKL